MNLLNFFVLRYRFQTVFSSIKMIMKSSMLKTTLRKRIVIMQDAIFTF